MPQNVRKTVDSEREPSLSVVVPTYRRPAVLYRLLGALEQQVTGNPNYSVVVVNDGSHDDAYAEVAERFQSMIDYLALPHRRGGGAARNAGARKARGRFLVFTDDDCVPPPHWLDWLLADLQEYPYAAVVGGPTRPLPSKPRGLIETYNSKFGFVPKPAYLDVRLRVVPTANFAVRRDWFDKVGGFDERYRYGNDVLLTQSLMEAGAPFHIDESWFTYHDQKYGLRGLCERSFRFGHSSGRRYALGEGPKISRTAPLPSLWAILRTVPKVIREFRESQYFSEHHAFQRLAFAALDLLRYFLIRLGDLHGYRRGVRLRRKHGPLPTDSLDDQPW